MVCLMLSATPKTHQTTEPRRSLRLAAAVRLTLALAVAMLLAPTRPAGAISIELKDVAPDRIERQRAATQGRIPFAGTPDTAALKERLERAGVKSGSSMMLRIFKTSSEVELWMEKDGAYILFATYPICNWSGTLGPKIREGDKQTPEGFYTITSRQLRHIGRWPRAMNLGFPNVYDEAKKRDGSYILMHGGCSSVGCFAMTNPVISEIYGLAQAAVRAGQRHIPVHVFPFRMTDENLAAHADAEWRDFWAEIKPAYDTFERTRRPPRISVCKARYVIQDAPQKGETADKAEDEKERSSAKRSRREIQAGGIRTYCPEESVAEAAKTTASKQ